MVSCWWVVATLLLGNFVATAHRPRSVEGSRTVKYLGSKDFVVVARDGIEADRNANQSQVAWLNPLASDGLASSTEHEDGLKVFVVTFNGGEAELSNDDFLLSRQKLVDKMVQRFTEANDRHIDVVMVATQELRKYPRKVGKDSLRELPGPLPEFLERLARLGHFFQLEGESLMDGFTKKTKPQVTTRVEVAWSTHWRNQYARNGSQSLHHWTEQYARNSSEVLHTEKTKWTKGAVSLPFTLTGVSEGPGPGVRFTGVHLDTKNANDNLALIGNLIAESRDGAGQIFAVNIIAGDFNTRIRPVTLPAEACSAGNLKELFRVDTGNKTSQFLQDSGISLGLEHLKFSAGLTGLEMPNPARANGRKFFIPTYKFAVKKAAGTDTEPDDVFDNIDSIKECKKLKKGVLQMGVLDFIVVLFDKARFDVVSDQDNTWDYMPYSDHAMVTGTVTLKPKGSAA